MLYYLVSSIVNTFLIILIVDFVLMGFFSFRFSLKSKKNEFVITKENKIDFQTNVECAGFSCAYILRHFGTEANGNDVYQKIQNKMKAQSLLIGSLHSAWAYETTNLTQVPMCVFFPPH